MYNYPARAFFRSLCAMLRFAVRFQRNTQRRAIHWYTIGDIYELMGEQNESKPAYQNAIQEYISAIALTTQSVRRADYWIRIADCYVKLRDQEQEKNALQEALNNYPLSAKERENVVLRLEKLTP